MTVDRIRRASALAKAVGGTLICDYAGPVIVDFREPTESELGAVELWFELEFVGKNDPDGEGWEFFSEDGADTLRGLKILLQDGEQISLKKAVGLAKEIRR